MKKIFYSALCAAGVMAMTACTADDPMLGGNGDGNVTFRVNLPAGMNSRAAEEFGSGKTATVLKYYVYDSEGTLITESEAEEIHISKEVTLNLVNGVDYQIVWFAQAPTAGYVYNTADKTVKFDYSDLDQNREDLDAFYACTNLKVSGASQQTVELYRPFAQLNFGTSDIPEDTKSADYKILENAFGAGLQDLATSLTVTTKVPNVLNLATGEVSGEAELAFNVTSLPEDQTFPKVDDNKDYSYLAMDYVLAPKDGAVFDLDFTINSKTNPYHTIKVASAPVRANYRTNIFGQLLTSTQTFNVEIKPMMEDLANWEVIGNGVVYDTLAKCYTLTSVEGLLWLEDQANNKGNNFAGKTIKLAADMDMTGIEWKGLYNFAYSHAKWFRGTFDGDGHTISNLSVSSETEAGFFAHTEFAVIKNLNLKNVAVNAKMSAGGVAGIAYTSRIENCSVDGGTIVTTPIYVASARKYDEGNNAGAIVGLMSAQPQSAEERVASSTGVVNCSVSNVAVVAYRCLGAVAGTFSKNSSAFDGDPVVSGNSAVNCTVTANMAISNYNGVKQPQAEQLFGRFEGGTSEGSGNTATNVKVEVLNADSFTGDGFEVSTPGALAAVGQLIATKANMQGKTINFSGDIDAGGMEWETPWNNGTFQNATVNGNGATISNLNMKGGFLNPGYHNGLTVKNLTFKNCKVEQMPSFGAGVGVVISQIYGSFTFENVNVIDCEATGNFAVGGLVGQFTNEDGGVYTATLKNCSVKNTKLSATAKGWIECEGVGGANAFIGAGIVWVDATRQIVVNLDNCSQSGNTFENASNVTGGGLWAETVMFNNKTTTLKN